jgi:hypothetical protein
LNFTAGYRVFGNDESCRLAKTLGQDAVVRLIPPGQFLCDRSHILNGNVSASYVVAKLILPRILLEEPIKLNVSGTEGRSIIPLREKSDADFHLPSDGAIRGLAAAAV